MLKEIDEMSTKRVKSNIEYASKILDNQCLYRVNIAEGQTLLTFVEVLRNVDEIKKITAILKCAHKTVNADEFIADNSRNYDCKQRFCVNVKRHNDFIDLEKLMAEMKLDERQKETIRKIFTEDHINEIYNFWIEDNQEYVLNDFLKGHLYSSRKWWEANIKPKILTGKKTDYPHLDNLSTKEEKLTELEEWIKDDEMKLSYLNALDFDKAGFYGRSGGWFSPATTSSLEDKRDTIDGWIEEFSGDEHNIGEFDYEEIKEQIHDLHVEMTAIQWVLNWIKDFNDGLRFEYELKFRIEEELSLI